MLSREEQIKKLAKEYLDILVIGGGATGAGVALDAASRGLKVALVEQDDFASGTSSRSTKLIHGGVRYLEQAVKSLDKGQYKLVKEALEERSLLLKLAPHLCRELGLITPLYKLWEIPYYTAGLKTYDLLAGKKRLHPSQLLGRKKTLKRFPQLKKKGLKASVLYYDGQFNDARMNVALALTAVQKGALVLNHLKVLGFEKNPHGRIQKVSVQDQLSSKEFKISTQVVINATGPFSDSIRQLADPQIKPLLKVSSGIHLILDKKYSAQDFGLLIPKTEDGRVLFLLPWQGQTLVGTTDNPAKIAANPQASPEDIDYLLRHIAKYLNIKINKEEIKAAWSGLRPLVEQETNTSTAILSRDHTLEWLPQGLLTITGGKWTTYRRMAMEAVNQAVVRGALSPLRGSQTDKIPLWGAQGYDPKLAQELMEKDHLDSDIAQHLSQSYGSYSREVAALAGLGHGKRLHPSHPYIEAEILHAIRMEMAQTLTDVLARRTRLAFLDQKATLQAAPKTLKIMAQELGWNKDRQEKEIQDLKKYLG